MAARRRPSRRVQQAGPPYVQRGYSRELTWPRFEALSRRAEAEFSTARDYWGGFRDGLAA
ncbi:hypothetical protein ACFVTC_11360 [Streptomyces sp. NPDC057950]|uniref:hypothetical protein n=1 Tax=Streptomyces sp. NPDC057950 TaxID=3346288 RepID=UPI0036ED7303